MMRFLLTMVGMIFICLGACAESKDESNSVDSSLSEDISELSSDRLPAPPDQRATLTLKEAEDRLGIELPKDATIIRTIELGAQAPKGISVAMHSQRPLGETEAYFRSRLDPEVGKRFLAMPRERWATRNMMGKQYRLAEYQEREGSWKILFSILSVTGRETVQVNVQRLRVVDPAPSSRPR